MDKKYKEKVGEFWSQRTKRERDANCWWNNSQIIRHVNKTICGEPLEGWNEGGIKLLLSVLPEGYVMEKAVSVGCGTGTKEMTFLEKGLVEQFFCFDFSEVRLEQGRQIARQKGLSDRIVFLNEDFFSSYYLKQKYDLVFWDNSLHHMPSAHIAVEKSYEVLKEGGIFFLNDFIGKSKFQWSDMEMAIVNGVRTLLPEWVFRDALGNVRPRCIGRLTVEQMDQLDPSEAADSSSILSAITSVFQNPFIVHTGGLIYHLGLTDILSNVINSPELLDYLLCLDDETIKMGIQHYAFALAVK